MTNKVKTLYRILLSTLKTVYYFIRGVLYFFYDRISGRYMKLPNNNKQDTVLVLGNGPSLNDLDLTRFVKRDFKIAVVNFFPARYDLFFSLKPDYLCLFDPGFFDYYIKVEEQDLNRLFEVLSRVDWDLKIIAPAGKKLKMEENDLISYFWVNQHPIIEKRYNRFIFWMFKRNISNYGYQNVILGALYFFLTCNYKQVFIAGVDMSDFKNIYVDENNRVYVDSTHAYGKTRNYFDETSEYGISKFSEILYAYNLMFSEFDVAEEYSDYLNTPVKNLSINSYIDSFKKIDPKVFENQC